MAEFILVHSLSEFCTVATLLTDCFDVENGAATKSDRFEIQ
jgi:hypothetical protein